MYILQLRVVLCCTDYFGFQAKNSHENVLTIWARTFNHLRLACNVSIKDYFWSDFFFFCGVCCFNTIKHCELIEKYQIRQKFT